MKLTFRKYWTILVINWQEALIYREELLLWNIIEFIPILVLAVIWLGVYKFTDNIGQFNATSIISYYVVGYLVSRAVSFHFEDHAIDEVNKGEFSKFLLKPISYIKLKAVGNLSYRFFNLLINTFPIIIIALLLFKDQILLTNPKALILMLYFLLTALIIELVLSFTVIAIAFYFDQAKTFMHLKWMLNTVLGGRLLPLSLFPEKIESAIRLLPFQYKFSTPVEVYLGFYNYDRLAGDIFKSLLWIVLSTLGLRLLWSQAIKKYSSVGN